MSPRFERRPEKRSGPSGSGRKPFNRGESRGEGGRPEGRRPEGRRFEGPRPDGGGRIRGSRPEAGRFAAPRSERLGPEAGPRPASSRPISSRPTSGRPSSSRPVSRPSSGRPVSGPPIPSRSVAARRSEGRRPGAPASRGGERWGERGPRRFLAPRPDHGVRPRFGKPFAGSRDRGGPAIVSVEPPVASAASLQGPEAERFGQAPADDLVWGRHPAQAALESGRPIHRIWCTAEMRFSPRFLQLLREAKASGVLVEEVTWARLGQLTGGAVHQGIVLQTAAAETLDLSTLIEGCRSLSEPPLLMAVDGLTDPHNLGAIVRSAESLGAHGLVLPQRRSAGLTGTVAKVAAGALEHLPVARVVNLNRSLETLKQEGYLVIGLAEEGTVGIHEVSLEGPLVVVTGSEGSGLSLLTRRHCDQLVRIPLRGATPSLNASVATALLLYEIARRGWMKDVSGTAPAPRIQRPVMPAPPQEDRTAPALDSPGLEASIESNPDTYPDTSPGANPESSPELTAAPAIEPAAGAVPEPLLLAAEPVDAPPGDGEPISGASSPPQPQNPTDQPPHPLPEGILEPSPALPKEGSEPGSPQASTPTSYFDADIAL